MIYSVHQIHRPELKYDSQTAELICCIYCNYIAGGEFNYTVLFRIIEKSWTCSSLCFQVFVDLGWLPKTSLNDAKTDHIDFNSVLQCSFKVLVIYFRISISGPHSLIQSRMCYCLTACSTFFKKSVTKMYKFDPNQSQRVCCNQKPPCDFFFCC